MLRVHDLREHANLCLKKQNKTKPTPFSWFCTSEASLRETNGREERFKLRATQESVPFTCNIKVFLLTLVGNFGKWDGVFGGRAGNYWTFFPQ